MSFIRPDDDPRDVLLMVVLVVIAVIALCFLPHPIWVWVR